MKISWTCLEDGVMSSVLLLVMLVEQTRESRMICER